MSKEVKVLGTGCRNCQATADLIEQVAAEQGADIILEKVEDMGDIMSFGVMSTPGVVVDSEVVHAGGVPDRKKVTEWLAG
jgi:small redox-active disulfide protein 2